MGKKQKQLSAEEQQRRAAERRLANGEEGRPTNSTQPREAAGGKRANKGHKQKGSGSVVTSKGAFEKAGITVKDWQRMPTQLLLEWTHREKRPRPLYMPVKARRQHGRQGSAEEEEEDEEDWRKYCTAENPNKPPPKPQQTEFRERVKLADVKFDDRSLLFCPTEPSPTKALAREHAALLALLHVQGDLPLERKLPDEFRDVWVSSKQARQAGKPGEKPSSAGSSQSTSPPPVPATNGSSTAAEEKAPKVITSDRTFASRAEARKATQERKAETAKARRRREALAKANADPHVFMSEKMRLILAEALGLRGQAEGGSDLPELSELSEIDQRVVKDVKARGFEEDNIVQALLSVDPLGDYEDCEEEAVVRSRVDGVIGWLVLHLREEDLPPGFEVKGRVLDVIKPNQQHRMEQRGDLQPDQKFRSEGVSPASSAVSVGLYGFPEEAWATAIADSSEVLAAVQRGGPWTLAGVQACFRLHTDLCQRTGHPMPPAPDQQDLIEEAEMMLASEIEALEAIYEQRACVSQVDQWGSVVSVAVHDGRATLDVFLPKVGREFGYCLQGAMPCMLLRQATLRTQAFILHKAAELTCGEACMSVVYEVISWVEELMVSLDQPGAAGTTIDLSSATDNPHHSIVTLKDVSPVDDDDDEQAIPDTPAPVSTVVEGASSDRESRAGVGRGKGSQLAGKRARRGPGFWNTAGAVPKPIDLTTVSQGILQAKERLPATAQRASIVSAVSSNQVVLISGGTGCGKTTQVPQFLLAEAASRGERLKMVIAQPRRIAAIGVASRVSDEIGQSPGNTVGYMVRGDSQAGKATQVLFCTTGVLLQTLHTDATMSHVTHLIIDEVHERHMDCDFLLAALRTIIPKRPDLRVILMSATLESDRFSKYFADLPNAAKGGAPYEGGECPLLHIPGFTHPVEELFLEDASRVSGYTPNNIRRKIQLGSNAGDGVPTVKGKAKWVAGGEEDLRAALDYRHYAQLVQGIIDQNIHGGGSILVFLPGVHEISRLCDQLGQVQSETVRVHAVPLHGALAPHQQASAFKRAPKGHVKVVVSTNIAETSITIDDCTVVIDSGRVKQTGYDPQRATPYLKDVWAAKNALKQRRGRAGRVRAGTCFRMFTREVYDSLERHTPPEICRTPLDSLVLMVKAYGFGQPQKFLSTFLDAPPQDSVASSVHSLRTIGALSRSPKQQQGGGGLVITPLGEHLACIPTSPRVAKMLVYGAVLGVLDAVCSIAAYLSLRSPFTDTSGANLHAKLDLKKRSNCGNSDHCLVAALMDEWMGTKSSAQKRDMCDHYALSFTRMMELVQLRHQFMDSLRSLGFDSSHSLLRGTVRMKVKEEGMRSSGEWRLVGAVVSASLYPNVVKIKRPVQRYHETSGGAVAADDKARELTFFVQPQSKAEEDRAGSPAPPASSSFIHGDRVWLHPGSINFHQGVYSSPWLVYNEIVSTAKVYVRDSSEVTPYALLLFGGPLVLDVHNSTISVVSHARSPSSDEVESSQGRSWVRVSALPRIGALINALRQRLDDLLAMKIKDPALDLRTDHSVKAMVRLLVTEGLGVGNAVLVVNEAPV